MDEKNKACVDRSIENGYVTVLYLNSGTSEEVGVG